MRARSPSVHRLARPAAAVEVVLAGGAVLADLWVPTFVLLAMAGVSLAVRRQSPSSLGLRRVTRTSGRVMAAQVFGWAVAWTLLQVALIMPVVEHLTGQRQDVSQFERVHGNLGMLLGLLVLSWTLAAVGEEVAYRGYVFTRIREVASAGAVGSVIAVAVSSVLFGFAHTEQGAVGVVLTTLDAVFFSSMRQRYGTLWAPVLAHGINNTIGLVTYFLVGPVYGLW